jgi:hypothetical protein
MEQNDGSRRLYARNGREYRLPELQFYIVDGYYVETRTVYEFFGYFSTVALVNRHGIIPLWLKTPWFRGTKAQ